LRDERVQHVEHDLRRNVFVSVKRSNRLRVRGIEQQKAPPIIDVRHGHVVERAGDPAAGFLRQDRHVDHLGHVASKDRRKMTRGTELIGFARSPAIGAPEPFRETKDHPKSACQAPAR
jgi:hypothetical protein